MPKVTFAFAFPGLLAVCSNSLLTLWRRGARRAPCERGLGLRARVSARYMLNMLLDRYRDHLG